MNEVSNKNPNIRIKISGEENVNICFPFFVVKAMLKSGSVSDSLNGFDIDSIISSIEQGARGKLLDVDSDGTKIEITAE